MYVETVLVGTIYVIDPRNTHEVRQCVIVYINTDSDTTKA